MLLKWVILLLVAWYVSKAFGNLILALRGVPIEQNRPIPRPPDDGIRVKKQSEAKPEAAKVRQIEDARFEDL